MLKHSPTTAGTVSAAALFASGSRYANWAVSVAPFAPDLASIYVGRPRESREVVRGSCIVGRTDGPGPARRQRGLWGAGRTVFARTPGSFLPDSRFDCGRGGRAPGDVAVGVAGSERVRGAVAKLSGLGWGLRYWWLVGWLGWRFRSAGWRPAGGVDFKQVGDGVLEGPFAAGTGLAAHREAAEPAVVLDVPEGSFGDWAAVAVGGDAWGGGQPGRHRGDRAVAGGPGRAAVAGGVFEVMAFAGGDQ